MRRISEKIRSRRKWELHDPMVAIDVTIPPVVGLLMKLLLDHFFTAQKFWDKF